MVEDAGGQSIMVAHAVYVCVNLLTCASEVTFGALLPLLATLPEGQLPEVRLGVVA